MTKPLMNAVPLFVGIALLAVAALATSCELIDPRYAIKADYEQKLEDAKACDADDECVLQESCLCPTAVNADAEEALDAAFANVECCLPEDCALADCIAAAGAECVDGRCVVIEAGD